MCGPLLYHFPSDGSMVTSSRDWWVLRHQNAYNGVGRYAGARDHSPTQEATSLPLDTAELEITHPPCLDVLHEGGPLV